MPVVPFLNLRRNGFRELDSAPFHDYVNVVIRSSEEAVTHVPPYHESPYAKFLGGGRDDTEDRPVKITLCYCSTHIISAWFPNPGKISSECMIHRPARSRKSSTRW